MPKIIAAGVGLPLIGTGATVTTSQPLLNLTQTWNNAAAAFTGLKLNVTDTASASGSLLMDLQVGGVSKASIRKDGAIVGLGAATFGSETAGVVPSAGLTIYNSGYLGWASSGSSLGTIDTKLYRDAANTLALRNGTAAQVFNIYNTYTDASNYEVGFAKWLSNSFTIGTDYLGTGSNRSLVFRTAGSNRWVVETDGTFKAASDNTYDIGASGANRPRNVYLGGQVIAGSNLISGNNVQTAGSGSFNWVGRSAIVSPSDGAVRIGDATLTNSFTMTAGASNLLTLNGGLKTTGATFALQTATTLTDNAAAQVATMTNGPAAGNPTKWIAINDNGTTRYIPAW